MTVVEEVAVEVAEDGTGTSVDQVEDACIGKKSDAAAEAGRRTIVSLHVPYLRKSRQLRRPLCLTILRSMPNTVTSRLWGPERLGISLIRKKIEGAGGFKTIWG